MNMLRFSFTSLMILIYSAMLFACTDVSEMRNQSFVVALGLDHKGENKIELSLLELSIQKNDQSSEEGKSPPFKIVQETCEYFPDCMNKMHNQVAGRFILSKVQYVLFGQKLLKSGISPYIDYFYRIARIDQTVSFFATDEDIRHIFQIDKGALIKNIIESVPYHPSVFDRKMWEVSPLIDAPLQSGILTKLGVKNDIIQSDGLYLFERDKLSMNLSTNEAELAHLLFEDPVNEMTVTYKKEIAYQIRKHEVTIKITPQKIDIYVRLKGWDLSTGQKDFHTLSDIMISKEIRESLQLIMNKTQGKGVDILGIGQKFRQKGWDTTDWQEKFKKLEIDVHVFAKVLSGYGQK
jgi:spore germination protein KC